MRFAILSAARPAVPLLRALPHTRKITIPSPELSTTDGSSTGFVIRTDAIIENTATALRLVREAEKVLGPVVSIDIPKDPDIKRGFKLMSIQTLKPAKLDETLHGELPASKVEKGKDTGGVSLSDVMAALGVSSPSFTSTFAVPPLQYKIDQRDVPPRRRIRRTPPKPTSVEKAEDSEIVTALRRLQGGFYGGFNGVSDQYADRIIPGEPAAPVVNKPKTMPPKPLEAGEKKTFDEILAESRAPMEAAKEQQQQAAVDEVVEVVQEVEEVEKVDPAEQRRLKIQRKAIEIARRNAALAAEARAAKRAQEEAGEETAEEFQQAPKAEQQSEKKEKKGWFPF